MKLSKFIVAVLTILLAGAMIMSIVSIVNIGNSFIKDDNGTSSDKPSGSTNKPAEPEAPEEPENYLEGSVVKSSSYASVDDGNVFRIVSGTAYVKESDGIIYCYVKYEIPSYANDLDVCYKQLELSNDIVNVYRYSYDSIYWNFLDEKIIGTSFDNLNVSSLPKNNSDCIYISFCTLSASEYTLDEALAEFEKNLGENCDIRIDNFTALKAEDL